MNILVTGANGYIGQRLIRVLLEEGHELFCCVRNRARFESGHRHERIHTMEVDFTDAVPTPDLPLSIDVAFYLIHSMKSSVGGFEDLEAQAAKNFLTFLGNTDCKQIVYLSGIVNEEVLSDHLSSRRNVERILNAGDIPVTVLRAGIVVGSGSASFEIVRDLVEKLPVMITPRWLNTKCQPIAVRNVLQFLVGVMGRKDSFGNVYDIGGPEVLTYKQMLLQYARVRGLKRWIFIVPVMTPRLSSYWLYFVTQTSYPLAVNLVDSMKVNIVARPNTLAAELGIELLSYTSAVELALARIEQHNVTSSWKDSFSSSGIRRDVMDEVQVPAFGCFRDEKTRDVSANPSGVWENIWSIGGDRGWYYGNLLWEVRGLLDKLWGGVGLNRGRTNSNDIHAGDALDFWRVLVADKKNQRLLLFAEMKLPGEAWLEFRMTANETGTVLTQTATFRPRGVLGRVYWYAVLPFHHFLFNGMITNIVRDATIAAG